MILLRTSRVAACLLGLLASISLMTSAQPGTNLPDAVSGTSWQHDNGVVYYFYDRHPSFPKINVFSGCYYGFPDTGYCTSELSSSEGWYASHGYLLPGTTFDFSDMTAQGICEFIGNVFQNELLVNSAIVKPSFAFIRETEGDSENDFYWFIGWIWEFPHGALDPGVHIFSLRATSLPLEEHSLPFVPAANPEEDTLLRAGFSVEYISTVSALP